MDALYSALHLLFSWPPDAQRASPLPTPPSALWVPAWGSTLMLPEGDSLNANWETDQSTTETILRPDKRKAPRVSLCAACFVCLCRLWGFSLIITICHQIDHWALIFVDPVMSVLCVPWVCGAYRPQALQVPWNNVCQKNSVNEFSKTEVSRSCYDNNCIPVFMNARYASTYIHIHICVYVSERVRACMCETGKRKYKEEERERETEWDRKRYSK